ncbi:uncharacterized protein B0H18DRAFT_962419 [Fomitopsis serialis]|uniref:uncharacterized protein n=1 Tax=Fomitopsis serialis TaxID=139415 RepID=UPI002008E87B|nr:uncharacterized protein B0H18DRAFT_962419 [Neoantrodia serialis]KAH9911253.1 hypothetical protein B0H18DRAFT_962419 [Neoantrodia serialis]
MLPLELVDAIFQLLSPHCFKYSDEVSAAQTALARCARTCRTYHNMASSVLWRGEDLSRICTAVLSNFTIGRVKWPAEEALIRVIILMFIWEHATPELVSVLSPSIRVLYLLDDLAGEENASQQLEFGYRMRRHAFKQLIPAVLQGLPDLEVLLLRPLGHKSFWSPFTSTPNNCFVNQNIRILHIVELSSCTVVTAALAAISTISNLAELNITVLGPYAYHIEADPMEWYIPSTFHFPRLRRLSLKGHTTRVAALVEAIAAPDLEDIALKTVDTTLPGREYQDVLETALSELFDRLRRQNAASLRVFSLILHTMAGISVFPCGTTADTPFPYFARPLLEIRHLQRITIQQSSQGSDVNSPALVATWPALRSLSLPGTEASPDFLQLIACECPQLERLEVRRLSKDFVDFLPPTVPPSPRAGSAAPDARRTSALRQLRTSIPLEVPEPEDATKVARFLDALFPRLNPGQCSLGCFLEETRNNRLKYLWKSRALDVLKEVSRLQRTRCKMRWHVTFQFDLQGQIRARE